MLEVARTLASWFAFYSLDKMTMFEELVLIFFFQPQNSFLSPGSINRTCLAGAKAGHIHLCQGAGR